MHLAQFVFFALLCVANPCYGLRTLRDVTKPATPEPFLSTSEQKDGQDVKPSEIHQPALFSTALPTLPPIPTLPTLPEFPEIQGLPDRTFRNRPLGNRGVGTRAPAAPAPLTTSLPLITGYPEIDFVGHPRLRVGEVGADRYPFNVVGNMQNGCTGTLVGPCHVLTAGHCVYSHERREYSSQLSFYPARNGRNNVPARAWKEYKVSPNWLQFQDYNADYAIVSLKEKVGTQLGWMGFGYNLQEEIVGLNIAGYPIDQPTGTMWFDYCDNVRFDYDSERIIRHGCQVVEGNSGSPMWVFNKETGFREIRAVHNGARITDRGNIPYASVINPAVATQLQSWIRQMQC
ncbi:hypothetical protein BSKO_01023 [Bryopsis sp. KO-2023]|nr:hypothetical protein BSKO_01023 [Bryopsis sp. KO-2023]